MTAQQPLDAIRESSVLSQRSFDLAPAQRTTMDLIENKTFDEKQGAISAIKQTVEGIARFHAD